LGPSSSYSELLKAVNDGEDGEQAEAGGGDTEHAQQLTSEQWRFTFDVAEWSGVAAADVRFWLFDPWCAGVGRTWREPAALDLSTWVTGHESSVGGRSGWPLRLSPLTSAWGSA
jgi:hypothetical protein